MNFHAFFASSSLQKYWLSWLPATEKLRRFQKFKFKIVIWYIFLSPIEFSEKKRPLGYASNSVSSLISQKISLNSWIEIRFSIQRGTLGNEVSHFFILYMNMTLITLHYPVNWRQSYYDCYTRSAGILAPIQTISVVGL